MLKVRKETASMLTRDGVRLDSDIYRPDTTTELPVLLMRQPYGKAIASTVVYAHPTWYAAHGYIVVIQDVRGRGTSAGEFRIFSHEIEDGIDAVNWAAQLPGSNGQMGMYGFSYQGMTQLYAASGRPSALRTICPSMIGYDLYADWAYEGGAFCLQANLGWAVQLAAETARLQGDAAAYQVLYAASRNLPFYEPLNHFIESFRKYTPNSFYYEWLEHPEPGDYWQQLSPKLQDVDLPMLHIGGWFDPYLRGTLRLYKEMANRSAFPQHLLVGAWAHLPWGRKVGAIDYGADAASPVDELQVRWFNQFLKGMDTGLLDQLPVCLFEMGSNQWRYFEDWSTHSQKVYYLTSSGLASVREDSGKLVEVLDTTSLQQDTLVHDPWRPVPALGGHAAIPAGAFERSAIDCRTDVLTYTSAPLVEALHIVGDVTIDIFCRADQPSFDLCAVLSKVRPDSSVYNFTQGYVRVNLGQETTPLRIALQPTCIRIAKGSALRLSLSAACFPAYPLNAGTGVHPGEKHLIRGQIITVTVSCGEGCSSQVLLPVVAQS
ncbi:CocE/NonD family hydrolase [Coleofasciculus sp. LEGE 07081]|uniref:CocE/NonD family hydrolase n=1 Tax=unclassified Coleofasciculus TaxID=2692782 RepID=UPI0018827C67|nr:CocE/NonD family hydrolase [Coleofasciculus sp. LEGE 07081]MBE9147812.1 CocE/NonD family hydrolase [Coleofasciculus sp. LEGE 07092]